MEHINICNIFALVIITILKRMKNSNAYTKLSECGIRPSVQRLAIMDYLIKHPIHPTVDDVYCGLEKKIGTLSRTTVYNTLKLFAEHNAAQMLTIDERRVCYDANKDPHVHFLCTKCGKVLDLFDENVPDIKLPKEIEGNIISKVEVYYKGICKECQDKIK